MVSVVAAVEAPVSFYDPQTRQNRPIWWVGANAPSLFYSSERLELIAKSPLFIQANENNMDQIQKVVDRGKNTPYSLSEVRRLQGLSLIEKGPAAEAGDEAMPSTGGVVGMVNQRFTWKQTRGVGEQYRQPVGLVGFLASTFSQAKNEKYWARSTYYIAEDVKKSNVKELQEIESK